MSGRNVNSCPYPLTWLDVFTAKPFAGNGLAVVHEADQLDAQTMQLFVRETQLSEATFVQRATQPEADYRNRIFSPPGEMRFAGHPSLGTAVAVAYRAEQRQGTFVQQTAAGCQRVQVKFTGTRSAYASMLQEQETFGEHVNPEPFLRPLGITRDDLHPTRTPQQVSTGTPHILFPVRDRAVLKRLSLRQQELAALLPPLVVLYIAAFDASEPATAFARGFFADRGTVREDPATGSAAGPLGAYLAHYCNCQELIVHQGVEMGRPSRLVVDMRDRPVSVGGDVVVVMEGSVYL